MTAPTVPVTINLADLGGPALAGVEVTARLSDWDISTGDVFVSNKPPVTGVTDVSGTVVMQLFPNAMTPDGLGTRGTVMRITARPPGGKTIDVNAYVPNVPCNLADVVEIDESAGLSAAQVALAQVQAARAATAASAAQAAHIYAGSFADDPAIRPDGAAVQAGDEYFNSDLNLSKRFNGVAWVASDLSSANLAAPAGSTLVGMQQSGAGAQVRTVRDELRASVRLDQFDTVDNARAQQKAASLTNVYDTSVGGVPVRTDSRGFFEHLKNLASMVGRHAVTMLRTTWKGEGQFQPGAGGAASSTNASAIALSQLHYTGGNSEPIQSISRSFGSAAQGGIIQDLEIYGGTGQYGGEWVLRDGEVVPSAAISAIGASSVTLSASSTTQYFGSGINTRSGVKRGRPLLNDTRKIALAAATLSGYQVNVASTAGIAVGDYFGFDADTQAVSIGTARHLSRIASVDDATHFTLDTIYEAAGYTHAYQGSSTAGAATVFPATLPSGYDPDARAFSFNVAMGSTIDGRFQVGDTVTQFPATDCTLIGLQVDLNGRINQKTPRDIGYTAVSLGRQALAGLMVIGDSALTYAFKYGMYLQNVSVGRFFSGFPEKETDNVNGVKNWHRNAAPSVQAADGLKGSIFQRQNGGVDKSLYVKILDASAGGDATQGWAPVQNLQESGWAAASMPSVSTLGFSAFVTELNHSAEWDGAKWVNGGYRCIGTAAQKPAGIWPGFRYYETDTPGLKTWGGAAWA